LLFFGIMTKLGRATEYGSFERGCKDINFADDITEKKQCGRKILEILLYLLENLKRRFINI